MKGGRCIFCQVEGWGSRDFICADCGSPGEVILHCAQCRTRFRLQKRAIEIILERIKQRLSKECGMAIRASNCKVCAPEGASTDFEVFRIRPPLTN